MWNEHASQAVSRGAAGGPSTWSEPSKGAGDAVLLTLVGCAGLAALLLSLATRWMA